MCMLKRVYTSKKVSMIENEYTQNKRPVPKLSLDLLYFRRTSIFLKKIVEKAVLKD